MRKTLYELGEKIRKGLTEEENALLAAARMLKNPASDSADATTKHKDLQEAKEELLKYRVEQDGKTVWKHGDLEFSDPEQLAHLLIAIQRANDHFLYYGGISSHLNTDRPKPSPLLITGNYSPPAAYEFPPEDPRLALGSLSVPHYNIQCQVDLDFAKRKDRLKNAVQLLPEPNASTVQRFIENNFLYLTKRVTSDCYEIRTIEYTAMACENKTVSAILEQSAFDVAKKPEAIQDMNKLLTVMEKVAGIQEGKLDLEDLALYNRYIDHPGMADGTTDIKDFAIDFPPPSAELMQSPSLKGITQYATEVFKQFFKIPQNQDAGFPDWDNSIQVDDMTIRERMLRQYLNTHPLIDHIERNGTFDTWYNNFTTWYKENLNIIGPMMIMAGLMSGKKVKHSLNSIWLPVEHDGFAPPRDNAAFWNVWGQFCNQWLPGTAFTTDIATGSQVQRKIPDKFEIDFEPFFFYPSSEPVRDSEGKWLDQPLERYAADTVERALTNLFGPTEQLYKDNAPWPPIDRNTLTIVDGKTVFERLQELHRDLKKKDSKNTPEFSVWYQQNGNDKGAQIVAAGLMAGKDVEAFVPYPDRTLPTLPTRIQNTGQTPTQSSIQSYPEAWARYCCNLGFDETTTDTFKEVSATKECEENDIEFISNDIEFISMEDIALTKRQRAQEEARERVRSGYAVARAECVDPAHPAMFDMFFGKVLQDNGYNNWDALRNKLPPDSPYRDAATAVAACIGLIACYDMNVTDILTPNTLESGKYTAAATYIGKVLDLTSNKTPQGRENNIKGLASALRSGQKALVDQYDRIMDQTKEDPKLRRAMMPELYCIGRTLEQIEKCLKTIAFTLKAKSILPQDQRTQKAISNAIDTTKKMFGQEKKCMTQAAKTQTRNFFM